MTVTAAASTSVQSTALDTVSMVPSTSIAWTALQATTTAASDIWAMRQVRSRNRRRCTASSATAKIAYIATTPNGQNGGGEANSKRSIISGGLVIQRPKTWITTSPTRAPPTKR